MFRPATLFIGLRYTRAKRGNRFISIISMMSIIGIALGVTVLITTLSVLNGFDREIKKSIFSMMAPIVINDIYGPLNNWQKTENIIAKSRDVTGVAPYITGQALVINGGSIDAIKLIGILPAYEKNVTEIDKKIYEGNVNKLLPNSLGIVIGEGLANKLEVKLGSDVVLMTSKKNTSLAVINPSFNHFKVVGIFRAGGGSGLDYNDSLAYINLNDAQKIFQLGNAVSGIHANVTDIYTAPRISTNIESKLPYSMVVSDWTQLLGDYFENIQLTKTIMFFIFVLIIIVAIFNLIGTLIMVVNNKRSDIAILRTLGATPADIMLIFMVQGAIIGGLGTFIGVSCGILLSMNVTSIVNFIQYIFHVQLISSNVYFVDFLPSEIQWHDVRNIALVSILLSLIATIKPAWKAARTLPAEALRYD